MTDLNKDGLIPGQNVDQNDWIKVNNAHRTKKIEPVNDLANGSEEVLKFDRAPAKKRGK